MEHLVSSVNVCVEGLGSHTQDIRMSPSSMPYIFFRSHPRVIIVIVEYTKHSIVVIQMAPEWLSVVLGANRFPWGVASAMIVVR